MHINEKQRGAGSCLGGAGGETAWGGGGDNQCEEVTEETGRGLWDIGWGQEGPPQGSHWEGWRVDVGSCLGMGFRPSCGTHWVI